MTDKLFPRTMVGGISLPRMIIGTNWILGYSHTGPAADAQIKHRFPDGASAYPLLKNFLDHGVDAVLGMLEQEKILQDMVSYAQEQSGKKMILMDTPILNVDDNDAARREARAKIRASKAAGATFCMPYHSCVEQLINKNTRTIERLPDYLDMIRQEGMIPGLSAHMPEVIIYSDLNGYDVETYIQIYNCMGFLMQFEAEVINKIIHNAKKPVLTIKPMAAGRCTPFVGLNFVWNTIREQDMVCLGCTDAAEVLEDVEYSFAALERRMPRIAKRTSPNTQQAALAGKEVK